MRDHWRTILLTTMLVVSSGALVWRLSTIQGLFRPARVGSGSMAPALLGRHFRAACPECGWTFAFDAEQPPHRQLAVCPNCGFEDVAYHQTIHRGERVLIDRLAYCWTPPARWDLVAFYAPNGGSELTVKRVVGRPGEGIAIRNGQLYVNGRICRKTLSQFRDTAILVHDSTCAPRLPRLPPRWFSAESGLFPDFVTPSGKPVAHNIPQMQWLVYRHWRCFENPLPRTDESPVLDHYGYNQSLSRSLNRVTDLMLTAELAAGSDGAVALIAATGREHFLAHFELASGQISVTCGGEPFAQAQIPFPTAGRKLVVELALVDQRCLLAVNQRELLAKTFPPGSNQATLMRQVSVGCSEGSARIQRLLVWRDVFYLHPSGINIPWESSQRVAEDACFVLGDNAPVSQDSRHDWIGPVPYKYLRGKVLRYR